MPDKKPPITHSPYDNFQHPDPPPDPDPKNPPPHSPDHGHDLSNLVPDVNFGWNGGPPSFNFPPPGDNGNGGPGKADVPVTPPIRVDLAGLRGTENSLLNSGRTGVAAYQHLRQHVMAVKDSAFGQNDTDFEQQTGYDGKPGNIEEVPGKIQEAAREFAAEMNPAMERALYFMGTTLVLFGEYIALLNRTGQTYAQVDAHSRFPSEATTKKAVQGFNPGDFNFGHGVPPVS